MLKMRAFMYVLLFLRVSIASLHQKNLLELRCFLFCELAMRVTAIFEGRFYSSSLDVERKKEMDSKTTLVSKDIG